MAKIKSLIQHTSGIPLGGLGTGSVEIGPDGSFHEWQIFNLGAWAPEQPECGKVENPPMPPEALSFFIRTQAGKDRPLVRRLDLMGKQCNPYNNPWLRPMEAIEFTGTYPLAKLRYLDSTLPVSVSSRMFSPFTPHDARTSGTPGFNVIFTVKNTSRETQTVALLGTLKNPVAWGAADRALVNTVSHEDGATFLTMRSNADMPFKATLGSLSFSVKGGEPSWISGEFARYFSIGQGFITLGQHSPYGMANELPHTYFQETGRLTNTSAGQSPANLLRMDDAAIDALTLNEKKDILEVVRQYAFVEIVGARILEVDPQILDSEEGLTTFLRQVRMRIDLLAGKDRLNQDWGEGALCSQVSIAPGKSAEICFALAWYFPNHYSATGAIIGHQYQNWFSDALDVNRFLVRNREAHTRTVVGFARTLYDTTLDQSMADAWAGQLSTLVKCTWWGQNGDFAVWEGLGCCGFHTTDVTYLGSFSIAMLFPELQKRQMEMGAKYQRPDGRVHHFFAPDFCSVDEGFDRVDMNQQFVLLACRDYLWTGDRGYLERLWPNIIKAMDNTALLDRDGDGLPDHDTGRNTYDVWNFFGTPSYIASLWLSALRAGIRMAEDLGDQARADQWQAILAKGVTSFEKKLWNGSYYSLWVDGAKRDECCMSDQIDGEGFTQLVGIGRTLPEKRIHAALKAIVAHNFTHETGLLNAKYPPEVQRHFSTYRNFQAMAPWTGIEYAIASMLFEYGMCDEGLGIVKAVHDRYYRMGRFWNHIECGDHYYRAMSSWAVLLSATGFKPDMPRTTLSVLPPGAAKRLRAPWVSSTGWGVFVMTGGKFALHCLSGAISFEKLNLAMTLEKKRSVLLNKKRLAAKITGKGGVASIEFENEMTVSQGDVLTVG